MLITLSPIDIELAMMSLELVLMLRMFVLTEAVNESTTEELELMLRIFVVMTAKLSAA
jgi:hypothetical protein